VLIYGTVSVTTKAQKQRGVKMRGTVLLTAAILARGRKNAQIYIIEPVKKINNGK
jgi:hypothetical protein